MAVTLDKKSRNAIKEQHVLYKAGKLEKQDFLAQFPKMTLRQLGTIAGKAGRGKYGKRNGNGKQKNTLSFRLHSSVVGAVINTVEGQVLVEGKNLTIKNWN